MAIIEESYGDFSKRVHGKAAGKRVPVNLDYDVTYRCNLNCRHCYCNLPANDAAAKANELTLPEITRILTEARDLGALWILLTGGEPLLRPDFKDIYLTTLKLGLIPTVFTNGTLIDEEWADFFAEHRPFKMEITLYGSNAEVYERVTRTPGSFEKCMRGIRLLKERGLPLRLKTMVMRSNLEDYPKVRELCEAEGFPFRLDPVIHRRYPDLPRDDRDPLDERLPVSEALAVECSDPGRSDGWREACDRLIELGPSNIDHLLPCGAGRYMMSISAEGIVRPCSFVRFLKWDSRLSSVSETWGGMEAMCYSPSVRPQECRTCDLASLCAPCAGWSDMEHGNPRLKVDYICEMAHARASVFSGRGGVQL